MQHSDISFFFDIALSYITFGLAIYAIAGFIALMWIHHEPATPRTLLWKTRLAYSSLAALFILDASRQLWDSFHTEHFPIQLTRIAVPALFFLIGNAVISIASLTYPTTWPTETKEESKQRKQAGA